VAPTKARVFVALGLCSRANLCHLAPVTQERFGSVDPSSQPRDGRASEVRSKVDACNRRVFVVDDNSFVRSVLERILRAKGYDVVACASGDEAVSLFAVLWQAVDVAIVDMCMPGMDGCDTFRAMRAIHPDVRVVLCSGATDRQRVDMALREGAHAFMLKPFTPDQVERTIEDALQSRCERTQQRTVRSTG
jgi:DNA-binding NtrC family response regulator